VKSPRPDMVARRTGRPMLCPACEGDVYLDAPHVCKPGAVMPTAAGTTLTFYAYNATNACCRDWMLLGWPEVDGKPKLTGDSEARPWTAPHMRFDCPKCAKDLWFNLNEPVATEVWDVRRQGKPQPPALVAGRIRPQ
jgi:hypothetical protein